MPSAPLLPATLGTPQPALPSPRPVVRRLGLAFLLALAGLATIGGGWLAAHGVWTLLESGAVAPTRAADVALVDEIARCWSMPHDPLLVEHLYAPEAVLHDRVAGRTVVGREAIDARVHALAAGGFALVTTSLPERRGDHLLWRSAYNPADTASIEVLTVVRLVGGRIVEHWTYPLEASGSVD